MLKGDKWGNFFERNIVIIFMFYYFLKYINVKNEFNIILIDM